MPKKEDVTAKTRVTAALLWGLVFPLVVLMIAWARHRDDAGFPRGPIVVLALGALLGAGLLIPRIGESIYIGVLRIFSVVGFIIGNVGLTLMFYLVVTPVGFALKLTGKDSMDKRFKKGDPPKWRERKGNLEPRRYYRLF